MRPFSALCLALFLCGSPAFAEDPQATLAQYGVELPENMFLEFQKPDSDRPRIVVFEQKPNSKFRMRVFYLQLVMVAGK